eukprot:scaffold5067_cov245-Pinguiococcus_pyrenoidosus.AAC.8
MRPGSARKASDMPAVCERRRLFQNEMRGERQGGLGSWASTSVSLHWDLAAQRGFRATGMVNPAF